MTAEENIYSFTRNACVARFGAHLAGPASSFFLVLAEAEISAAETDALQKSAEALGWSEGATFVLMRNAEGAQLTQAEVYEIVEALDPICIVVVGAAARECVEQTFRCEVPTQGRFRLFGRDACAFNNLGGLLESDAGKQTVWALLRGLPHAP